MVKRNAKRESLSTYQPVSQRKNGKNGYYIATYQNGKYLGRSKGATIYEGEEKVLARHHIERKAPQTPIERRGQALREEHQERIRTEGYSDSKEHKYEVIVKMQTSKGEWYGRANINYSYVPREELDYLQSEMEDKYSELYDEEIYSMEVMQIYNRYTGKPVNRSYIGNGVSA